MFIASVIKEQCVVYVSMPIDRQFNAWTRTIDKNKHGSDGVRSEEFATVLSSNGANYENN